MRRIDTIKRRLDVLGMAEKDIREVELDCPSPADSVAHVLTNMPPDDANVVELQWADEKPADDRQKIRWLRQYSREQLAEIRREWRASTGPRAKAALVELDRLEPLLA